MKEERLSCANSQHKLPIELQISKPEKSKFIAAACGGGMPQGMAADQSKSRCLTANRVATTIPSTRHGAASCTTTPAHHR
jgi:hypothetical protein